MDSIGKKGLEILNAIVKGWESAGHPLPGDISYQEAIDWLDGVGADPSELIQTIEWLTWMGGGKKGG